MSPLVVVASLPHSRLANEAHTGPTATILPCFDFFSKLKTVVLSYYSIKVDVSNQRVLSQVKESVEGDTVPWIYHLFLFMDTHFFKKNSANSP
jgi:hypothetical protein